MDEKSTTVEERERAFADAEAIMALANNSPMLVDTLIALAKPEINAADPVGATPVNDPHFQQLRRAVIDGRMTFDEAAKAIIDQARKKERRRLADEIGTAMTAAIRSTPPEGADAAAWVSSIDMDTNKVIWFPKDQYDEYQRLRFTDIGEP